MSRLQWLLHTMAIKVSKLSLRTICKKLYIVWLILTFIFLQTSQTATIMNGRKMVKVKTKMENTNPAMISPSRERRQLGSHMSETKQKQHNNNNKNNENTTINDQVLLQFIYFRIESMELECMTLFMMVLSYLYLQIYKNI